MAKCKALAGSIGGETVNILLPVCVTDDPDGGCKRFSITTSIRLLLL